MHALRSLVRTRRRLSLALVALALCMKALLPAGYMVSDAGHVLTVTICTGTTDTVTKQIAIPTKGDTHRQSDAHGKDTAQCPFSSLSMAATGGADAPLLALALAFILVLGFLPAPALPLRRTDYFQPPLRGPPATA